MTVPDHDVRGHGFLEGKQDSARQDDIALIARIRTGDEGAFGMLLDRYLQRLTHFVYAMVGSRDMADDVVQTTFAELWVHRAALPPLLSVSSYLFRLVRNRALNERRARRIRSGHRERVEAAAAMEPIAVASPEGAILNQAMLDAALRELPEQRCLALRLRYIDELSHEEIGEVLEISAEAARKLVVRGLQDLRKILGVSA